MAQVCVKCGKKIGAFSNEPLVLKDDHVLCFQCSEKVRTDLNNIYSVKNTAEFTSFKEEILYYCKQNYDDTTTELVENKISEIWKSTRAFADFAKSEMLLRNSMLTTGYEFYGYAIKKYVGLVRGQVVLGTGFLSEFTASFSDFFGTESNSFAEKLETAQNAALEKMILKSNSAGGNAIVGISFDYITFSGNMIGVVANGTSVVIEKITAD